MKAIVFDLGITRKDVVEKPINKDYLMVTPIKALISGLENAIYSGFLWVEPNRILGSSGIVKINNVGIDVDKSLEGKTAVVLPYSNRYGGIGTEIDGILAEKAVIPLDSIVTIPEDYSVKYVIYPYVSIGLQLRKIFKGYNVLIAGGGISSYISALALVGYANRVAVYNEDGYTDIRLYGVEEIKKGENYHWEALFITTMRAWIRVELGLLNDENKIVAIPRLLNSWPTAIPANLEIKFVKPAKMDGVLNYIDDEVSEKVFNQLIILSDDIISSLPTPRPGVIVDMEKEFKKKI
ncbi:alcohol dehydrogenase [Sulfolobus acidocaldarius SUSAZ]|nr:alcohol dehydrogenase [Sulfolobus acidocaldarius SUSAZ]